MGGRAGRTRRIIFHTVYSPRNLVKANVNRPSYQCLLKACTASTEGVKRRAITFCTYVMDTHTIHLQHCYAVIDFGDSKGFDRELVGSHPWSRCWINPQGSPMAKMNWGPLLMSLMTSDAHACACIVTGGCKYGRKSSTNIMCPK